MTIQFQNAFWIAQPVLEVLAAAVMFRRKLHRPFPVFFSYLLTQAAMFCVLYPVKQTCSYAAYFYCYWISAAISLIFGFKVIYEIFLDVFRPYHALKDLGAMLFKWSALVMLLAAIVIAMASPMENSPAIITAILVTQRGVRVIHCGLILLLLIFSRHLGVSWKQNSFGIALGFGLYSAIELGTFALHSAGRETENMVALLTAGTYCISILVWLSYAFLNNVSRQVSSNLLTSQRWNQTLADIQNPKGDDALIPMFEGMVDRALSRSPGQSFMRAYAVENPVALPASTATALGSSLMKGAFSPASGGKF